MPDVGLDTMQRIQSACQFAPGAGVLQLLAPCMVVGVFIYCHGEAGGVQVMC
jgi:hypothetical protein